MALCMSLRDFLTQFPRPSDRASAVHQTFVSLERSEDWEEVQVVEAPDGWDCAYLVQARAAGETPADSAAPRSFLFYPVPHGRSASLAALHRCAKLETAETQVALAITTENRVLLHWMRPLLEPQMLDNALQLKERKKKSRKRQRERRKAKKDGKNAGKQGSEGSDPADADERQPKRPDTKPSDTDKEPEEPEEPVAASGTASGAASGANAEKSERESGGEKGEERQDETNAKPPQDAIG